MTVEDRMSVRAQIKAAYLSNCKDFEDLLATVAAVEEELLHIGALSRLDYFKNGFEFDSRVKLKRKQLVVASSSAPDRTQTDDPSAAHEDAASLPEKRKRS